ncbi:MAG: hypothetical protein U1F10_16145 [Burkholderiales bacterium]
MRNATKWGAFLRSAAAALVLWALVPAAVAQTVTCPGNSCDVVVTVGGTPAAPVVAVNAPELRMSRGARNPVITWKLEAAGYEFRTDSIRPYGGPSSATKRTTTQAEWDDQCTRLNTSGTAIRIRNKNDKAVSLYYDVKVYRKSDGKAFTLDPVIMNDP